MAGADGGAVRQRVGAQRRRRVTGGQNQRRRVVRQRNAVEHVLQQGVVGVAVAHQHGTEHVLLVFADHQLAVDAGHFVLETVTAGAGGARLGIAHRAHVHAHQFQLGAHVGAGEIAGLVVEHRGHGARHGVARRHQPEDLVVPERAFTDREDRRVRGAALVVHHDAAALAQLQTALAAQAVLRADAGGEHDHVGFQRRLAFEVHAQGVLFAGVDQLGFHAGVDVHAERFHFLAQQGAAGFVQLHRHQLRREFHHMGFQPQQPQRVGGFQPEQAAAHHHAAFGVAGAAFDRVQVVHGAVHQAVLVVVAGDRRHERIGTGGQHQGVVVLPDTAGGDHGFMVPVDLHHLVVQVQRHPVVPVPLRRGQTEILRGLVVEQRGQMHPVVGGPVLAGEHMEGPGAGVALLDQGLHQVVTDHAVADDHQVARGGKYGVVVRHSLASC